MKIGTCSYSFSQALNAGRMSVEDMFRLLHEWDCQHLEIPDFSVDVYADGMAERLKEYSEKYNIEIASLSYGSNIGRMKGDDYKREMEKLFKKVDTAHAMGATLTRCDFVRATGGQGYNQEGNLIGGTEEFESVFEGVVTAAKEFCDYAWDMYKLPVTSENHGILVNGGDRIRRLVRAVDKPNYGITMDIGNSCSVGEDPMVLIEAALPFAKRVHVKDFYLRDKSEGVAIGVEDIYGNRITEDDFVHFGYSGWILDRYQNYMRGAIVGHGDLPLQAIIDTIAMSDFDGRNGQEGYLSTEFEGIEDCIMGTRLGIRNLKNMLLLAKEG